MKSYGKLYLHILEIGMKKVNEGLSYNELKSELQKKNYDFENDCIEKAVKHWLVQNFVHLDEDDNHCTKEIDTNLPNLEEHKEFHFILKGDACLSLLNYQNANRTLTATKITLIIAVLALLYNCITSFFVC